MKQLIAILSLFFSFTVIAQDVSQLQYSVEPISYKGQTAAMRRSNAGEINKYMAVGAKNFEVANSLRVLEDGLNSAHAYLLKGERKITWLPHMYEQVNKIKKAMPKYGLTEYEQELKLYEIYNADLSARERVRMMNIDSVRRATALQKERKRLEEEAVIRNRNKKNQVNQDSVKKSFAAMMALAAQNEATAQKEYHIKTYGKQYGELISQGLVKPGMTKDMCMASLGVPASKTKPDANDLSIEVWQYRDHKLKFKDDKLVSVDDK